MSDNIILLPSKPRIVSETETKGVYEIDGLYPGYGHTLGNSLRRIILSSLPGAAITSVKIAGAAHEFSTLSGVKEDVITILLHLKQLRFKVTTDEPQTVILSAKGITRVTGKDIQAQGQVEVLNGDIFIAELTEKGASLEIEMTVQKGLGFVPKDVHQKEKMDIGAIAVDAIFSPIRRVSYEVENMRVGDKTNHNRLRISIETDGTLGAREALETSIATMIRQLEAVLDIKPEDKVVAPVEVIEEAPVREEKKEDDSKSSEDLTDVMKTRVDTLDLSTRTLNSLAIANIRTLGGLARKKKEDLLEIEGIGEKGILEIKKVLDAFGITLK